MRAVVKIGSSSIVAEGKLHGDTLRALALQISKLRAGGHEIIVVTSGAAALGSSQLGLERLSSTPSETQVTKLVGQIELMNRWQEAFATYDLAAGQVLLTSLDLFDRRQYLHARDTLESMLGLGIVPLLNENDAYAEAQFGGGNDRLAALVAHMLGAELLVLLTDIPGIFTADPRLDSEASLIDEIVEVDNELERAAGGAGELGTGGMASKLAAAKIAAWSGIPALIASAHRENIVVEAVNGGSGLGTTIRPRETRLRSRKLWIAFAVGSKGRVVVDQGAATALAERGKSLLLPGVRDCAGSFLDGDAVEVCDESGTVFAKGLARQPADRLRSLIGKRSTELPDDLSPVIIHRDDLVVLPS